MEPVEEDRALADGDYAQISYKGEILNDPAAAAGEGADEPKAAEAQPIAGEDTLVEIGGKDTVEAFNSSLRGAKPGQELKVEVIYPADYPQTQLAGKTVSYDVEVKGIKKRILPELNDDFAKELGHYESYADLEKSVREYMANRKQRSVESETKDKLFAALVGSLHLPGSRVAGSGPGGHAAGARPARSCGAGNAARTDAQARPHPAPCGAA